MDATEFRRLLFECRWGRAVKDSLKKTTAVAHKELQLAFATPLVYVFWCLATFIVGAFFYFGLVVSPEPNLRVLTVNMAMANLVLMPMIGMRTFAEEERQGTLEMMLTLPGNLWSIILGKFIMGMILSSIIPITSLLCSCVLAWFGTPDWGAILSALMGQGLCLSFCLAISMFASSMTKEPIAAGLLAAVLLIPFWMVDSFGSTVDTVWLRELCMDFSLMQHLTPLSKGVVALTDVCWFGGLTAIFLWGTERMLEYKRCQ